MEKHVTIMNLAETGEESVAFTNHDGPDALDQEQRLDSSVLTLALPMWNEMGQPSKITVTVQPGDHLNDPPTNVGGTKVKD